MSDRLANFVEASNAARTSGDLFDLFSKEIALYGYDRFMYSMISEDTVHAWHKVPSIMRNYPEDWMKFYVESGFMAIDPLKQIAFRARRALLWYDVPRYLDLDQQQKNCLFGGIEAGLYAGIGVPFHGPYGELAGIGLASSNRQHEVDEVTVRKLELIAHQFHVAHIAIALGSVGAPPIELSRREREVLLWCARGKSNWDIGEILGVSENTIRYFIKRCGNKLDTTSKIGAVLKAIRLGLICP